MTPEPSAWILVIGDRDSLAWVLAEGRTAFPATRARAVQRLKAGDKLFIYTTRGCFHSPTRHRGRVIGEATVLGPVLPLKQPVRFVDRIFPLGCDLRIDSLAPLGLGVDLASLVPQMDVFAVKESWPVYLRRTTVPLGNDDAQLLRSKLNQVATTPSEWIDAYLRMAGAGSIAANR
jgi:hypothetical protein